MKFELPNENELLDLASELVLELESEQKISFLDDAELTKEEFLLILFKAFKIFIEEFPAEGYRPLSTFTDKGVEIQNSSTINLVEDDTGFPFLNVKVFRDDNSWVFNGYVNFERILGYFFRGSINFISSARKSGREMTDDEFKQSLINVTLNILSMAMIRMPKWIELMIDSFESKIDLIWGKQVFEEIKDDNSLRGITFPTIKISRHREKSIRAIESKIREFLQDNTGFERYLLNIQKKTLALAYKDTYSHWESMQSLQLAGKNWRRYVRAYEMSNITDDLIEDFISDKKIADIALEHAARQANILNNERLSARNLQLRSQGIKCSGYSRSKLFEFKKEGEKFIEMDKAAESSIKTNSLD